MWLGVQLSRTLTHPHIHTRTHTLAHSHSHTHTMWSTVVSSFSANGDFGALIGGYLRAWDIATPVNDPQRVCFSALLAEKRPSLKAKTSESPSRSVKKKKKNDGTAQPIDNHGVVAFTAKKPSPSPSPYSRSTVKPKVHAKQSSSHSVIKAPASGSGSGHDSSDNAASWKVKLAGSAPQKSLSTPSASPSPSPLQKAEIPVRARSAFECFLIRNHNRIPLHRMKETWLSLSLSQKMVGRNTSRRWAWDHHHNHHHRFGVVRVLRSV